MLLEQYYQTGSYFLVKSMGVECMATVFKDMLPACSVETGECVKWRAHMICITRFHEFNKMYDWVYDIYVLRIFFYKSIDKLHKYISSVLNLNLVLW